jgi:hypothetical protein
MLTNVNRKHRDLTLKYSINHLLLLMPVVAGHWVTRFTVNSTALVTSTSQHIKQTKLYVKNLTLKQTEILVVIFLPCQMQWLYSMNIATV